MQARTFAWGWLSRAVCRLARAVAVAFVAAGVLLTLGQRRLLYCPERFDASGAARRFEACGLVRWPEAAGAEYRALVRAGAAGGAPVCGTVLLFHGNAGSACDRAAYGERLGRLGWRVVLAEYPGYGARPGRPGEAALVADGRATAREVRARYPGRFVLVGESLGAGVAAAVAADPAVRADAVVLVTPWDCLATVAAQHYPWLPVRYLLFDRYDSTANLKSYDGPVTVLLAEEDEIIPEASTLALYRSLPRPDKRLIRMAGATHNDWFWLLSEARWREALERGEGGGPP